MIAQKDELELISGINCKGEIKKAMNPVEKQPISKRFDDIIETRCL